MTGSPPAPRYGDDHFATWSPWSPLGKAIAAAFHLTNLFSMIVALVGICYGLWIVLSREQYSTLIEPRLYVSVGYILVVVGAMAVLNCAGGFYFATQQMRCFIYSYTIGGVILFIMLGIGGVMGFVFRHQLMYQTPMHVRLLTSMRELYGDREELTIALDRLQTNFQCCAVNGTDDFRIWRTSKWYMRQRPAAGEAKMMVPESCCARTPSGDYVSRQECLFFDLKHPPATALNTETCYLPLRRDLLHCALIGGSVSLAVATLLLIPAFFAAVYACMIQK